jgi:hypothetical protein
MKAFVLIVTFAAAGATEGDPYGEDRRFRRLSGLCIRRPSAVLAAALGVRASEPARSRAEIDKPRNGSPWAHCECHHLAKLQANERPHATSAERRLALAVAFSAAAIQRAYASTRTGPNRVVLSVVGIVLAEIAVVLVLILILILVS